MQFPTICSPAFLFFILASTKLVASAPLPYNSGRSNIPKGDEPTPKFPAGVMPNCEAPNVTTLPSCLASPDVEECTEWVQKTALPRTQRVPLLNGRSADIPGPKQPSTREVEYSETPGPEAPGVRIPKAPAPAGDTPHVEVETLDTKLPDTKAPKTQAPEATDVNGALKKAPTGVDLLHIPNTDIKKVKPNVPDMKPPIRA